MFIAVRPTTTKAVARLAVERKLIEGTNAIKLDYVSILSAFDYKGRMVITSWTIVEPSNLWFMKTPTKSNTIQLLLAI